MTATLYVNDLDTSLIGVYPITLAGWLDTPSRSVPAWDIPGRAGEVGIGEAKHEAREFKVTGTIDPTARTVAAHRTAVDQFKDAIFSGLVRVGVDDGVNSIREIDAVLARGTVTPKGHPLTATVSDFNVTFRALSPLWRDRYGTVVSFGSTPVALPLGNGPALAPLLVISGSATTPIVTYASAGGRSLQTLTLATIAASAFVEIDLDAMTVSTVASGVRTSTPASITAGGFFAVDPGDGDQPNGAYPMLSVSAGTGELRYVKGWL